MIVSVSLNPLNHDPVMVVAYRYLVLHSMFRATEGERTWLQAHGYLRLASAGGGRTAKGAAVFVWARENRYTGDAP